MNFRKKIETFITFPGMFPTIAILIVFRKINNNKNANNKGSSEGATTLYQAIFNKTLENEK